MIPKESIFSGEIKPKVYHSKSEAGHHTQRYVSLLISFETRILSELIKVHSGFCPECGTVLFNHVSEGGEDEHWAIKTGGMVDPRALRMDKEIFMASKLPWVPTVTKPDAHYTGMPRRKKEKSPQTTIDERVNEQESLKRKLPAEGNDEGVKDVKGEGGQRSGQTTIEQSMNDETGPSKGTKRKKTS